MGTSIPSSAKGIAAGAFLLLLLFLGGPSAVRAQAAGGTDVGIEVGEPFPQIPLPTLEGREGKTLAEFRGQKVILHVFASW